MVMDPTGNGGTLLDYDLDTDPDPLRVGRSARLKLVAFNRTDDPIDVARILVTLPVGPGASDLVAAGSQIEVGPPEHWQASVDGGTISLTPDGGKAAVKNKSLEFTIAITLNGEAGSATVLLTETAASPYEPSQPRSVSFDNAKYPQDFTLGELRTVPPGLSLIPHGARATLMWQATGDGVHCTLSYVPGNSGRVVTNVVPMVGTIESEPLTRKDSVTFTLTAEQSVVGQDNPLVLERRLDLPVESLSLDITVAPPAVGVNGLVRLTWQAPNAEYCQLDDGTHLAASGESWFVLSARRLFTVTAFGPGGESLQRQATVEIDPSITGNEAGWKATGKAGVDGDPAYVTRKFFRGEEFATLHPPTAGSPGEDAELQVALPPLDTSTRPVRIIPLHVAGGAGGKGGDGLDDVEAGSCDAADGGKGGDARLTVAWDSAVSPAQFIVTVTGGTGGAGHVPGADGSASAVIDGKVVALP